MTPTHSAAPANRYETPRVERFGSFREITRQGFSGNADGGLILSSDGTSSPAGTSTVIGGSR